MSSLDNIHLWWFIRSHLVFLDFFSPKYYLSLKRGMNDIFVGVESKVRGANILKESLGKITKQNRSFSFKDRHSGRSFLNTLENDIWHLKYKRDCVFTQLQMNRSVSDCVFRHLSSTSCIGSCRGILWKTCVPNLSSRRLLRASIMSKD